MLKAWFFATGEGLDMTALYLWMIAVEKLTGRLVSGPDIITRGFVFEDTVPDLINNIGSLVSETLKVLDKEISLDPSLVNAKVRSVLKISQEHDGEKPHDSSDNI